MPIIVEAIHTVTNYTPARFDRYIELYEKYSIAAIQDAGMEILGVWKFTTGLEGRDLLLMRFDSPEARAEQSAVLANDARIAEGLIKGLVEAGIQISEDVVEAAPFEYGDYESYTAALESSDSSRPRQFALRRYSAKLLEQNVAHQSLKKLAADAESGGPERLALAYNQSSGRRGTMSEIWYEPAPVDLRYRPHPSNVDAHDQLQSAIEGESVELLNPLPYSRLQ